MFWQLHFIMWCFGSYIVQALEGMLRCVCIYVCVHVRICIVSFVTFDIRMLGYVFMYVCTFMCVYVSWVLWRSTCAVFTFRELLTCFDVGWRPGIYVCVHVRTCIWPVLWLLTSFMAFDIIKPSSRENVGVCVYVCVYVYVRICLVMFVAFDLIT